MKLKINVTPTINAVMYHVGEFCSLKGQGLGTWSEQTGECPSLFQPNMGEVQNEGCRSSGYCKLM